jgi:diguanylate cyclase (GGDEF)-like protein
MTNYGAPLYTQGVRCGYERRKTIETNLSEDPHLTEYEREAYRECLEGLYRQTPNAIAAQLVASALVVYAMSPVVADERLVTWWLMVLAISVVRLVLNAACLRRWPLPDNVLDRWTLVLGSLTLVQTFTWGLAAFMLWPDDMAYRAFLVVVLAGVIASGGVILAVHRNSFLVYCIPVLLPVLWQLFTSGSRLEWILGALTILYSLVLVVSVNRLGNNYIEGLVLRLQMQALSRKDALTGLANRRGFDEYLMDSWQNAIRSRQSLGLLIADIDFFKGYNDEYGHPQGDDALRYVSEALLRAASRGTDLCGRVGGEEFAIVLPSTDIDGARQIADQIQQTLEETPLEYAQSPFGRLTVSIGLSAVVPRNADSLVDFYKETDKALYDAKNAGRNRIAVVPLPEALADSLG